MEHHFDSITTGNRNVKHIKEGNEDVVSMWETDEMDYSVSTSASASTSEETIKESVNGEQVLKKGTDVLKENAACQALQDFERCRDAVFKAKYDKGFSKQEAFKRILTRTFLIPTKMNVNEPNGEMLDAVVPKKKFLQEHFETLLGPTPEQTERIRVAQEKLRDQLGSTVSPKYLKKLQEKLEKKLQLVDRKGDIKPLPIEREEKYKKGYIPPRVPIKKLERVEEPDVFEPIAEPDMNRMKNTLWRIQSDNYEMVYPVSCEMRRRNRILKAAQKTHLGPASYYVDEYYDIQKKKQLMQGGGYLKKQTDRFQTKKPAAHTPNPTAYGNPYEILEKSNLKRNGALRTIFQTALPFKKALHVDQMPDMCCYSQVSSVEKILKSGKGIFYPDTVDKKVKLHRNKAPRGLIKFGFYRTEEKDTPPSNFTPKTFIDIITDPRRKLAGVFSRLDRDAYDGGVLSVRQPRIEHAKDYPGPGHYSFGSPWVKKNFSPVQGKKEEKLCCTMKTKYEEPGNPAYYNERRGFSYLYKNIPGGGAKSVFKSETSRVLKGEQFLFIAERLKGSNVPVSESRDKEFN